jgi:hypothetical protein
MHASVEAFFCGRFGEVIPTFSQEQRGYDRLRPDVPLEIREPVHRSNKEIIHKE